MRTMMQWTAAIAVGIVLVALSGSHAKDAAPSEKAPEFKAIPGVDGKEMSLADLGDAKVVVVAFTCNGCPVAASYEDRCIEFTKKYADKGARLVAINVKGSETLDEMKKRSEERGFNYPYLYDASQASAKSFGAKVTPHFFVLDQKRTIRYAGSFDDDMEKPTSNFVTDAVDALLAGKDPAVTTNRPFGCGISYKKN
jgi:peroxiredoxin